MLPHQFQVALIPAAMMSHHRQSASTTILIAKDYLHFSAAHFTIFSATERENLHGHNFQVRCEIRATPDANGLCFDYNLVKSRLAAICQELDECVLMAGQSPYMKVAAEGDYQVVTFAHERIPFLPRDLKILPVSNITIEALSQWFLDRLRQYDDILKLPILELSLGISSGSSQWADSHWDRT